MNNFILMILNYFNLRFKFCGQLNTFLLTSKTFQLIKSLNL